MLTWSNLRSAAFGLVLVAQPAAASPQAVVELFTSQGCASCPPADSVLAELARRPEVVALSLPVDYWDYLGWKDTLAQPAFSARQRAYAAARGDRQVYTPQIVVNGTKPCVGSDRAQIERSIAYATGGRASLPVNINVTERDGRLIVEIDDPAEPKGPAEVWVLPVAKSRTVTIAKGENRDRTITYANVVRAIMRIGEWRGGAARFEVPLSAARADADAYVVLLQAAVGVRPGLILGAAKSPDL